MDEVWTCAQCTVENQGNGESCYLCRAERPVSARVAESSAPGAWRCNSCTYENGPDHPVKCEMCGSANPDAAAQHPQSPGSPHGSPNKQMGGDGDGGMMCVDGDLGPESNSNNNYGDLMARPPLLRQNSAFANDVHQAMGGGSVEVSPQMMEGVGNLVKAPWETLANSGLTGQWLAATRHAALGVAANKALAARALLQKIVEASILEDQRLLRLRCLLCDSPGSQVKLLLMPDCRPEHPVCVPCTRRHILQLIDSKQCDRVSCAMRDCDTQLETKQIRSCLSASQWEQYIQASLHSLIENADGMVTCPDAKCGAAMEVASRAEVPKPPAVIKETDESGKVLSPEAWTHFQQYRIRCRECQANFCSGCKTSPYHMGFTCLQFASYERAEHCRFCEEQLTPETTTKVGPHQPAFQGVVCKEDECVERMNGSCEQVLSCGHACRGVRGEKSHPPCIVGDCAEENDAKACGDDLCNICWTEELQVAPLIQLECGHFFHQHCAAAKIDSKWNGSRITFSFLDCPLCKQVMKHDTLRKHNAKLLKLKKDIETKALARLEVEDMLKDDKLVDPSSRYHGKPLEYAMSSFAFYSCFKCNKPYFGGRRDCEQNAAEERPAEEFVCYDCADLKIVDCKDKSHKEYHVWKCRFCCNIAVWFCFGTTHYCEPCHKDNPMEKTRRKRAGFKQCEGPDKCPIKGNHAPNGKEAECEHNLGCGMCQDEHRKEHERHHKDKKVEEVIARGGKPAPNKPKGSNKANKARNNNNDNKQKKKPKKRGWFS